MDAATPFRRLLPAAAAVLLAAGCAADRTALDDQADARKRDQQNAAKISQERATRGAQFEAAQPVARPQMPADPTAPVPAAALAAPIPGQPAGPAPATPASYSPERDGKPGQPKPELPGDPRIKIVAIVGGNIVTDEEVWEAARQRMREYISQVDGPRGPTVVKDAEKEKAVYRDELRRIIERELILNEMYTRLKKAGKTAVIDEIKGFAGKAADRSLREMGWKPETDEAFRSVLLSQGLTVPVIHRQIERQIMADEYVRTMLKERGRSVGLTELRAYYDAHPDEFRTADRVKWQDIFISVNKFPTARGAYDHALAVRQQAAGGGDFAALSKQYDHGLSGLKGGVGIGTERGQIQPAEVEPAVWALKAGEVSGLVETAAGYHVLKVTEREYAGVKPFDEKVQAEIRRKMTRQLQEREYKRMVEDLWWKAPPRIVAAP